MIKEIFIMILAIVLTGTTFVYADDVSIDSEGNVTTGVANPNANLEVTGASAEDAIVGSASGTGAAGVYGINTDNGNYGILGYAQGVADFGVYGYSLDYGVYGTSPGYAGYFEGDAVVTGTLTVGTLLGFTENDPQVGSLTTGMWCTSDGSQVNCSSSAPVTSETDPIFVSSPASGITAGLITNWNTAYGWGDHASAGYDTTDDSWAGTGDVYTTSGNVGIGTSSPTHKLEVRDSTSTGYAGYFYNDNNTSGDARGLFAVGDASGTGTGWGYGAIITGYGGSTGGYALGIDTGAYANGSSPAYGVYSFATGGTTSGREWAFYGLGDSYFSGDVGIGTSSPGFKLEVFDSSTGHIARFENTSTSTNADGIDVELGPTSNPGTSNYFIRFRDGDGTHIGGVSGNGSGGVFYGSVSDARLKTKINDFEGGLDMVSRMKVRKYEFIESPGNERIGFLAQELQTVFPEAVSGDPEGDVTEEPMGVAYGRLTPVLVEAIQELNENKSSKAEVEVLKAENETLKKSLQEQEKTIAMLIDRLNELERDVKLEGSLASVMK
jgi:hypothetical protein